MRKFFSLFAAVLFAGSMVAAEAVMAKGTTNSYDDNTVNGKETIKMGKSGAGGNMTITVAAGATSLSFYSAAWKNEGAEVTIEAPTGVTITPASYTVVATDELSGSGKSFTVANEENYKFTFALTGVTEAATFTLTSAKRCFVWGAEDDTKAPSLEGYFLVGTFNDWKPVAKYMLDANETAEGEYVLACPFAKGDGLKVAKVQGDTVAVWYPEGMGNEYKVDADHVGRKAIYFRPESKEDWKAFHEGGFFFIPANIDPKNCEEAAEAALSVLNNNDLYKDSAVYTIEGFVTEIAYAYDSTKHNMSFWMADIDNGGKLIQAYKCVIEKEEDAVKVGDKVKVTGCLTRYNETPEFAAGCTVEIVKDEPEATWTVAGSEAVFGSNWNPADANNDMIKQEDGSYLWEKENITLAAGNIEFKVCKDHAWKEAYPEENYQLAISEAGVYRISIGFNAEAQTIAAIAQKTGEAEIDPTVSIAGSMNGWSTTADVMTLAEDKLSASLTLKNLAAGKYDFKVVLNGGEWRSNAQEFTRDSATALDITGNLDNMKLVADVDGDYSFIWLFEKNALAILYPSAAEADTIFLDVDYAEAMHFESYGAWQLNFYKDYDPSTYQVTYPDLYIGVVEKSATALAGTYSAEKELMFVQVYTSANDSAEAVAASDLEITYLGEGIYSVLFGFIGDDSNVYILQGEFEFEAYEYGTWAEIELVEEQGIEEIMAESENGKAIKLFHEGQIYILKGNKLYNLSGQVVR